MKTYMVGSHVEYTITVLENGKYVEEYQGVSGNWYQQMGEAWEPVFFESDSISLDEALARFKESS
jgi:hypothetical protein